MMLQTHMIFFVFRFTPGSGGRSLVLLLLLLFLLFESDVSDVLTLYERAMREEFPVFPNGVVLRVPFSDVFAAMRAKHQYY